MTLNGYTGIAEKGAMVSTLINIGSFEYIWWTNMGTVAGDKASGDLTSLAPTGYVTTAGNNKNIGGVNVGTYKRIGNLPVRWKIFYYTCDSLQPFTEADLKNTNAIQSIQGVNKRRVEKPRIYFGRVESLSFTHDAKSPNDFAYQMVLQIDQYDDFIALGDSYIAGI
jgi:hypothetical protein